MIGRATRPPGTTPLRLRLARGLELVALTLACLTFTWGPLAQGSTTWWGAGGLTVLGCAALAVTLLAGGVRGQLRLSHPAWLASASALLLWIWASTLWAPDEHEAARWAGIWTGVLGGAVSLHLLVTTRARQAAVLTLMVLTGAAALGLAYLQTRGVLVPGFSYYPGVPGRLVTGPYFNPSHFSGFLIPMAALLASLMLFTRPHLHTLALAGLLVLLHYLDFKTDSSSIPAVLLATGLPLLVWVWTKSKLAGAVLTALGLGAVVALGLIFFTPRGQATFARHQGQIGLHTSWAGFLDGRRAVWRYGREMWRDNPVGGVGIGQFTALTPRYRLAARQTGQSADARLVNYAHNDVLQVGAELGGVGVALFAGVLLLPLLGKFLDRRRALGTLAWAAGLPALAFAGVYDGHLTAIPGTAAFALALCALAAVRLPHKQGEADDAASPSPRAGLTPSVDFR